MNGEIRDAFDELRVQMNVLVNETGDEVREKVLEFSKIAEDCVVALARGEMTLAQAEEAKTNIALATRSALVNSAYAAQERTFDALLAGVSTAFRLIVLLA